MHHPGKCTDSIAQAEQNIKLKIYKKMPGLPPAVIYDQNRLYNSIFQVIFRPIFTLLITHTERNDTTASVTVRSGTMTHAETSAAARCFL